jgi:hypothetical protein
MTEQREYWPAFKGGEVDRRFKFADYRAMLLTGMRSLGSVEYLYILLVFKVPEGKLCLCVTSEKNGNYRRKVLGDQPFDFGASHFLCLFPGQGHVNLGSSNEWAQVEPFTARALEEARKHLKVTEQAVEELIPRKPWWRFW